MNLNAIEIRHLRYFVVIAESRSFRAASERLHISQPPLTRQVQQLEELLGTQLFVRQPRGIDLTPAGRLFYEDARNILTLTEQALDRMRLAGLGELGRLDVGVFGSAALDVVPRIIQSFRKQYPQVQIVLHNLDRAGQIKALQERRLTVGFNRFFGEEIDLEWESILTERLHVAVLATHPFAERSSVAFGELQGQPLVLYPRNPRGGFIDQLQRMFFDHELTPTIVQEVDDVVTAVALVSAGAGISIVVDSACNLSLPGVVYVPLREKDRANIELCMIRRSDDESPLLQAFLAVARNHKRSQKR
ncbi:MULTISPECIES: LysR family transcriptional regulator [Hydrocarboniphaga]|jgi:DNA-binding transcriptional LysR family regulator|uniref:LysR-family transcriptional regulator n=1 Tax=Hydrocarboniphaga effusa AP103 TaxID=1172194 RepID=I8TBQ6_9GAMM|nr:MULTISPECIES: LysR family transcriptional regulator [Hydrocarboniphaga]EIT70978.1 LysR-family transcriptional regulator [Hydrocarboniphaga effusa AP103]MDZ4079045.1 LysR family transcriptional regulator [Hydrocarboniphaga sp.]